MVSYKTVSLLVRVTACHQIDPGSRLITSKVFSQLINKINKIKSYMKRLNILFTYLNCYIYCLNLKKRLTNLLLISSLISGRRTRRRHARPPARRAEQEQHNAVPPCPPRGPPRRYRYVYQVRTAHGDVISQVFRPLFHLSFMF